MSHLFLFWFFSSFVCYTCFRQFGKFSDHPLLILTVEVWTISMVTRISFLLIRWARHGLECKRMEHDLVLGVSWSTLISELTLLSLTSNLLLFWLLSHWSSAWDWHIRKISLSVEDLTTEILGIVAEPARIRTKANLRWNVNAIAAQFFRWQSIIEWWAHFTVNRTDSIEIVLSVDLFDSDQCAI